MFLDINKIGDEPLTFDEALDLSDMTEGGAPLDVRDARLVGTAWKADDGVDFEGRLTATVTLECGRCLTRFESRISTEFFLTLVTSEPDLGSGEFEVTAEDTHHFQAEGGRADYRDIAREQIYLNLPLKAVCAADCKGLCPTCGANRNRVECGCRNQDLDPRLAPLLDLKLDSRKKSGDS